MLSVPALAEEKSILVQSTTSTANSGLYDDILPIFTAKTGIKVHVVAVGTGQAIKNAQNG
ncbi:MAG: sulfate transporter, partial [Gammaproteobacteria bacterium]|nr:sulfate transporter [Gammaproteobacteria bacterium]